MPRTLFYPSVNYLSTYCYCYNTVAEGRMDDKRRVVCMKCQVAQQLILIFSFALLVKILFYKFRFHKICIRVDLDVVLCSHST